MKHLVDTSLPTALPRFFRPSASWADLAMEARGSGHRIGALTNTFQSFREAMKAGNPAMGEHIAGLFGSDLLESYALGLRKPTPAIFVTAADHFGVDPERVLFIDDAETDDAVSR